MLEIGDLAKMERQPEIIVALDMAQRTQAVAFVAQFAEPVYFKIGMENFYALGADFVRELKAQGHRIFLDLKLHDIPNTVARAIKPLAGLGVDMLNVHAAGGVEMMRAAVESVKQHNPDCRCIAVTILTSLNEQNLQQELKITQSLTQTVLDYAQNAKLAGLDGVVCSVHEVAAIHRQCGADFICVTPGITYQGADAFDQKRTASPRDAKNAGADLLVIGRAISQSAQPYQTYLQIKQELAE